MTTFDDKCAEIAKRLDMPIEHVVEVFDEYERVTVDWAGTSKITDGAGGLAVEDGFGNVVLMCDEPNCDLGVVRPGKFQCSAVGPLCPNWSDHA